MPLEVRSRVLGRDWGLDVSEQLFGYWIVFVRLLVGWWFLHAGLHKYFADEPFDASWFVAQGDTIVSPLMGPFSSGVGLEFVNFMIPLGQILIGLGLVVGLLTRLAAFFGATLMFFFYFANQDWTNGFVNGDLMGLVLFATIIAFGAGRVWGLDAYVERTDAVRTNPRLRYLLG